VILIDGSFGRGLGRSGGHEAVLLAAGNAHRPDAEGPQRVGGEDVFAEEADDQVTVRLRAGVRPVQVAFGLERKVKTYSVIIVLNFLKIGFKKKLFTNHG
jgi:hypothetical protein